MKLLCIANFIFICCLFKTTTAQTVSFNIQNCNSLVAKINTNNTADGYLFVISEAPTTFSPQNGVGYAYSLVYGFGPNVSDNSTPSYTMYFGNENVTLTGFNNNTTYYYSVFFYTETAGYPIYSIVTPLSGELNFLGVPLFEINPINVSCNDAANGYINLKITNGVVPFEYVVNGIVYNTANPFLRELSLGPFIADAYAVILNDANGCSNGFVANITEPPPLEIETVSNQPVTCFNGNDGAFEFTLNGTVGSGTILQYNLPVDYSIDTNKINGNLIVENLPSGDYKLLVNLPENDTCTDEIDFKIDTPMPLELSDLIKKEPTCKDARNGEIAIEMVGGIPPYTYSWRNVENDEIIANGSVVLNLKAGNYHLEVFDANFCTFTTETNLLENEKNCFNINDIPNVISPNGDAVNDTWYIKGLLEQYPMNIVTITNRWGDVVFEKENCSNNCWDGNTTSNNKTLPTGTYFYVIQLNSQNAITGRNLIKGTINLLR